LSSLPITTIKDDYY